MRTQVLPCLNEQGARGLARRDEPLGGIPGPPRREPVLVAGMIPASFCSDRQLRAWQVPRQGARQPEAVTAILFFRLAAGPFPRARLVGDRERELPPPPR